MREILFRGQHRKCGQKVNMAGEKLPSIWVYGGIFPGTGDYSIIYGGKNENFTGAELDKWPVYSETVGQYTGLTDKNGKKIFEGDIIRHYDDDPYDGVEEKGVVFWDEEFLCFRRTSNGGFHHGKVDTYRLSKQCDYEIIGNIHDNPELLKGAENDG